MGRGTCGQELSQVHKECKHKRNICETWGLSAMEAEVCISRNRLKWEKQKEGCHVTEKHTEVLSPTKV